jgi:hypothetical protein
MPEYRFYTVEKDGHLAGPPTVHNSLTDDAAVTEAKKLLGDRTIEIWQGTRVVYRLDPTRK